MFFRFDTRSRIIIYGWVNDDLTLRTYGARTDAYSVFKRRLDECNPPDDWNDLLKEASAPIAIKRLKGSRPKANR